MTECYLIAVNDLFRIPKHDVEDPEEAKRIVQERIGTDGFEVYDTEVIDEITVE